MGHQEHLIDHETAIRYAERAGVRIRALEPRDVESISRTMDDRSVYSNTLQVPFTSIEQRTSMTFADPHTRFLGAIPLDPDDDVAIGNIGLHRNARPRRIHTATLGMGVRDEWQGRGVGSALMAAALYVADNWWQVTRIQLEVFIENEAGIALYRKFGFNVEGTLRADTFRDGVYVDSHVMARLHPSLGRG